MLLEINARLPKTSVFKYCFRYNENPRRINFFIIAYNLF